MQVVNFTINSEIHILEKKKQIITGVKPASPLFFSAPLPLTSPAQIHLSPTFYLLVAPLSLWAVQHEI